MAFCSITSSILIAYSPLPHTPLPHYYLHSTLVTAFLVTISIFFFMLSFYYLYIFFDSIVYSSISNSLLPLPVFTLVLHIIINLFRLHLSFSKPPTSPESFSPLPALRRSFYPQPRYLSFQITHFQELFPYVRQRCRSILFTIFLLLLMLRLLSPLR